MSLYSTAQRFLRRHTQSPRLYSTLRRGLLVTQHVTRRPDEPDFRVFRAISGGDQERVIVDVGANAGQSAVAFGFTCPSHQIVSFEPNPTLWGELRFVRRLLGSRFEFRQFALGSVVGEATLLVPHIGDLPVSTRASLSEQAAGQHQARLRDELGRSVDFRPVVVPVSTLDQFGLRPIVIKIDVEGFELDVLTGALGTIETYRPLLMIEENEQTPACKELLVRFDYGFFKFDKATRALTPGEPADPTRNWFAVPADSALRQKLGL